MTSTQEQFRLLLREAQEDPLIVGLVLTGSRGKGFGSEKSDFDVLLVVRQETFAEYRARFADGEEWAGLDCWVTSLPELDSVAALWSDPLAWEILCNQRYSFANVSVLVDKTGQLQRLVDDKGFVPEERRLPIVRTALAAYTNSHYRSLKCQRDRNHLGARLEATDAIGHALTAIFALEGRHRPYYGYLERELAARPLTTFPLAADDLLAMIDGILDSADAATLQRLLAIVKVLGRQVGRGRSSTTEAPSTPGCSTTGPTNGRRNHLTGMRITPRRPIDSPTPPSLSFVRNIDAHRRRSGRVTAGPPPERPAIAASPVRYGPGEHPP